MENQGNRVLKRDGMRLSLAPQALCAAVFPLALLCDTFATRCESTMEGTPAILESTLQVHARVPVKRVLRLPASRIMVFARERGVDVLLEVMDSAGHVLGEGDSPIRRSGVQRVEFTVRPHQQYYLVVTGKEHSESSGSVDIRVVDLDRTASSSCLKTQSLLASADAWYASGQAVTRAVAGSSPTNSNTAYATAAGTYASAVSRLMISQPSPLLAEAQLAAAAVEYQDVQSWSQAKSWAAAAARTYDSVGDDYGSARARAIEAAALIEIGVSTHTGSAPNEARLALGRSRALLQSLAGFHAERHELYDEALALNNMGIAYYVEDRYDEAIDSYKQALAIFTSLKEHSRQVLALQNMALVEYELGRLSSAILHYRQVLDAISREENPKLLAIVLNNSALANWASGNEDVALQQYADSLALSRTIQDAYEQAVALHGLASVYNTLGDQTRALSSYKEALALRSSTLDVRGRTASLRAIANLLRQQGHAAEALEMHREALSLASAPSMKARIVVQIAKDLDDLGRPDAADREVDSVLARRTPGNDVEYARALQERALHRISAGDLDTAQTDLAGALKTFQTYALPSDEFAVWVMLAGLERRRGHFAEALACVDHALDLAEEVRHESANPELRSTLMQPLRPAFDLKIGMLADRYFEAATDSPEREMDAIRALQTSEHARARALSDFQNIDVTVTGLDPRLLERRQEIYRQLAARRFRLEASLDHSGTTDAQAQAIRSDIATLRQSIDEIDAQIGAASEKERGSPSRDQRSLLRADRVPADVAVIEYWLGAKDAYAWVVTHAGVKLVRLGASSRINVQAMAFHEALRGFGSIGSSKRLAAGEQLYGAIIGPLASQISAIHTLIFAPDGALHYVPFAALRAPGSGQKSFLVESHDIAVAPSLEMLLRSEKRARAPADGGRMLLVADPVYGLHDARVTGSASGGDSRSQGPSLASLRGSPDGTELERLPGATREAAAIAALLPSGSLDRLEGFSANRDRFLSAALDRYRFIHIASHASTDAEIPQASALILSTVDPTGRQLDGRVLAADFMSVRFRADTVVLSACDTALGKSVAGEGLIGLHYVVLARGARSVVSSLWPASDQVAADMMARFYSALLHQHTSVISAWSAASREMLLGPYADPGTWGAFMLTLSHIDDVGSPGAAHSSTEGRSQ